jgi:heme oxygenase
MNMASGLGDNIMEMKSQESDTSSVAAFDMRQTHKETSNRVGWGQLSSQKVHALTPCYATAEGTAVASENPRKKGMALQLDDGTRKSHSVAENSAFVTGFFRGLGAVDSFSQLTTSFYFVYEAMEGALDRLDCASLQALDFPALRRMKNLERDLAFYHGPDWRSHVTPSRATVAYVKRIEEVAASDEPELLIGHLYSRYLGDLFGGQMMSGMAVKTLGENVGDANAGLAFYDFAEIDDTKRFIEEWYIALNALDLSDAQREAIVDEANVVFRLNIDIFEELEGNPVKSVLALALQTLKDKLFRKSA